MPRDRLETELFETETTTIMNSVVYKVWILSKKQTVLSLALLNPAFALYFVAFVMSLTGNNYVQLSQQQLNIEDIILKLINRTTSNFIVIC